MNAAAIIAMRDALAAHGYSVVKTSKLKAMAEKQIELQAEVDRHFEPQFADRPLYPGAETLYASCVLDALEIMQHGKDALEYLVKSRERECKEHLFAEVDRRGWIQSEWRYSPLEDRKMFHTKITVVKPLDKRQDPPWKIPYNPHIGGAL